MCVSSWFNIVLVYKKHINIEMSQIALDKRDKTALRKAKEGLFCWKLLLEFIIS